MKRLEELGISPVPWTDKDKCEHWIEAKDGFLVASGLEYSDPNCEEQNAKLLVAAPKLYEKLRQSTNMIEHSIQFVKNEDIKNALRKLANENKSALAEASGEREVKQ